MNRNTQLDNICMHTNIDNRTNPIEFQGHRSKVKVIFFVTRPKFTRLLSLLLMQ